MKNAHYFIAVLSLLLFVNTQAQVRRTIDLNENWKITSINTGKLLVRELPDLSDERLIWYEGDMPGQVQEFIYEKGELPDPAVGDNAKKWAGVFEKDWIYIREFTTPDADGEVLLCFDGLDTEVDIFLNGEQLTYCNNMFRRWKIPVTGKLKPSGEMNSLVLRFYPPQKVIDKFEERYPGAEVQSIKYIRKSVSDFKSYLGAKPPFLKTGIFDNVYLDLLPDVYFGDVQVQSFLNTDFSSAKIQINSEIPDLAAFSIDYQLVKPDGSVLTKGSSEKSEFSISVDDPELWYPMNYGSQPIYSIKLRIRDRRKILDEAEIAFGIRDIQILQEDEQTGNALFCVQVNGKKIFMNGACWAPLHGFTNVWNEERADSLLHLMTLGNMNFLRIWGAGTIPGKSLFDFCDRNGIIVMMEFMTSAPLRQPIEDPGFRENITLEFEDEIKLLRNHPSIAFWNGGNEHYLGNVSNLGDNTQPVGRELFQKIMPETVERFDPQRYCHPSSPWGGDDWINGNYPLAGDFHDYATFRFQPLNSVPLFTTEVCMVSPYSVHNMRKYMSEDEFWPEGFKFSVNAPGKKAWPPGWEYHSLGTAWEKIGRIDDYLDIESAEDACRVFGMAHGQYIKERYERQRRGVPDGQEADYRRSWGAAVWRLNDTWPMIYMSVIDYYLEPKIPYYFLKRASEPLLISFEQTNDKICVWVVNDTPEVIADSLTIELITFDGNVKKKVSHYVELQPSESKRVVDLTHEFHEIWKRREFLVARLGEHVKSHLLYPEKYLKVPQGEIQAELNDNVMVLEADKFIKGVELEIPRVSGAVFSDNYFDLIPGEKKIISVIEKKNGSQIKIKGLNSDEIQLSL